MGRLSDSKCSGRNHKANLVVLGTLLVVGLNGNSSRGDEAPAADVQESEELMDKIVAIVDSTPILYSKIQEKVKAGPLVVVSDFPATEDSPPFDRAMNDAINYELIMDKVSELDIAIKDGEVEEQIEKVLKNQNLDRNGLNDFLAQQGKTYDEYKDDFRNQMLLMRFKGRAIAPLVKITDKDIETYYLKKVGAQSDAVVLDLRQILIQVDKDASADVIAAKEKLAKEIYQKISGGTEFVEAVKLYSDGPDARTQGGLMQGVRLKDLSKDLRTEIENLQPGEYTTPIRTAIGFHIFLLESKKFSANSDFLAQRQQLEYELRNQELAEQTRRWLADARQKSKIEILNGRK